MAHRIAVLDDYGNLARRFGDWDRFGEVLLWNTATWADPIRLHGYNAWVECVVFSPDGRLLVSTGGATHLQGEVKLWNWPRR